MLITEMVLYVNLKGIWIVNDIHRLKHYERVSVFHILQKSKLSVTPSRDLRADGPP